MLLISKKKYQIRPKLADKNFKWSQKYLGLDSKQSFLFSSSSLERDSNSVREFVDQLFDLLVVSGDHLHDDAELGLSRAGVGWLGPEIRGYLCKELEVGLRLEGSRWTSQ